MWSVVLNYVGSGYVMLAAVVPISWLIVYISLTFVHRLLQRRRLFDDKKLLFKTIRNPFLFLLILVGAHSTLPTLHIPAAYAQILSALYSRLYIVVIIWLLIKLVSLSHIIAVRNFDIQTEDNLRARKVRTQFSFLQKTTHVLLIFIGAALLLMTFPAVKQVGGSLIASAGLVGIILGFAAQKTIGTFLAGFQIAFTQPIRIDDVVIVEKEWGQIEEITLSYVVVRIWDKRRLIVPINYFTEKPFENWTRTGSDLLSYVFLNFDYSVDLKPLREHFQKLLEATPLWDRTTSAVQVTNVTEKTIQVRFLMSARNSSRSFDLACYIREKMLEFVHEKYPDMLPKVRINFGQSQEEIFS